MPSNPYKSIAEALFSVILKIFVRRLAKSNNTVLNIDYIKKLNIRTDFSFANAVWSDYFVIRAS